jgi:hypothetical protein
LPVVAGPPTHKPTSRLLSPAYLARSGADINALIDLLQTAGFTPHLPQGKAAPLPVDSQALRRDPLQRDVLWQRR